jgi:hypothetical protein
LQRPGLNQAKDFLNCFEHIQYVDIFSVRNGMAVKLLFNEAVDIIGRKVFHKVFQKVFFHNKNSLKRCLKIVFVNNHAMAIICHSDHISVNARP